jgi:hypothetical protein
MRFRFMHAGQFVLDCSVEILRSAQDDTTVLARITQKNGPGRLPGPFLATVDGIPIRRP